LQEVKSVTPFSLLQSPDSLQSRRFSQSADVSQFLLSKDVRSLLQFCNPTILPLH